mmetsp:Transcript_27500/g.62309  ORF Transcript_27500/g.62309 Transcript_27500/m.62309 type:complete len:735 (-) Transcript_27500:186-2390(-)
MAQEMDAMDHLLHPKLHVDMAATGAQMPAPVLSPPKLIGRNRPDGDSFSARGPSIYQGAVSKYGALVDELSEPGYLTSLYRTRQAEAEKAGAAKKLTTNVRRARRLAISHDYAAGVRQIEEREFDEDFNQLFQEAQQRFEKSLTIRGRSRKLFEQPRVLPPSVEAEWAAHLEPAVVWADTQAQVAIVPEPPREPHTESRKPGPVESFIRPPPFPNTTPNGPRDRRMGSAGRQCMVVPTVEEKAQYDEDGRSWGCLRCAFRNDSERTDCMKCGMLRPRARFCLRLKEGEYRPADLGQSGCSAASIGVSLAGNVVVECGRDTFGYKHSLAVGTRVLRINDAKVEDGDKIEICLEAEADRNQLLAALAGSIAMAQPVLEVSVILGRSCIPAGWMLLDVVTQLAKVEEGEVGALVAFIRHADLSNGVTLVFGPQEAENEGCVEAFWRATAVALRGETLDVVFAQDPREIFDRKGTMKSRGLSGFSMSSPNASSRWEEVHGRGPAQRPILRFRSVMMFSGQFGEGQVDEGVKHLEQQGDAADLAQFQIITGQTASKDRQSQEKELFEWLNTTYQMNIKHMRHLANGATYLQICDSLMARKVPMKQVDWAASPDFYDEVKGNYHVLREVFHNCMIMVDVDVRKMCTYDREVRTTHAYKDANLELLVMLKGLWDTCHLSSYDPMARRWLARHRLRHFPEWAMPVPPWERTIDLETVREAFGRGAEGWRLDGADGGLVLHHR